MEEARTYIESGILELYVLGDLSLQERNEVEVMAAKYPEIRQEILAIEIAIEKHAQHYAVQPSEGLADKIISKLDTKDQAIKTAKVTVKVDTAQEVLDFIERAKETSKVAPLNTNTQQLNNNYYDAKIRKLYIALAACAALLVISLAALFSTRNELGNAKNEIIALNLDKQKFATEASYLKESNTDLQKITDMANDPDWKTVKLAGTAMDPKAKMIVYWHKTGQHVMVDNSKMQLPANDQNHQYQLWALVDGKPVDLGVFDAKADSAHILLKMKEINGAQAFAVTLEKRGGSATPTMTQMIVMGGVSI